MQRKDFPIVSDAKKDPSRGLYTPSIPSKFIDAIIVHELAHLREKNHQKSFWNVVYQMMPDYEAIMSRGKSYSTKTVE